MDKSPDAYRTISEVADELGLPQHVLRFWETRFPQIKPLKRGGGRRYYKPDDIDLVRGIKTLLYSEGYTIKGVQRILKEDGVKPVQMVGRGNAFSGERRDIDEPDDDVFTANEMEMDEEPASDLRASRAEPAFAPRAERNEPMLGSGRDAELNATVDPVDIATPKSHSRAAPTKIAYALQREALMQAAKELQECARLVELLREKA